MPRGSGARSLDAGEAVVGLAVEPLASGGDGTIDHIGPAGAGRRCARPTTQGTSRDGAGPFANAGPDCYWRAITRVPLSIGEPSVDWPSGEVRLAIRGELDLASVDRLTEVLGAQLAAGRLTVCADLSALTFCGVSGLNGLLAAHRTYEEAGSVLVLTGCDRHLTRYLRLTGLDQVLNIGTPTTPAGTDGAHPEL